MDYIGTPFADNLQLGTWTPRSDSTINNPPATSYAQAQSAYGLSMILYSDATAYAGWLTATDVPVTVLPTHFYFEYTLIIDDPTTVMCHTIETQVKITDNSSPTWTYSMPAQWLVESNWELEVGSPTGVTMPTPPNPHTPVRVALECILDTVNHQARVGSFYINRQQLALPTIWTPAAQQAWGANIIHPQLLQINNTVVPGGHSIHFDHMAFTQ